MKKLLVTIILTVVIIFLSVLVVAPIVNDNIAKKTADKLVDSSNGISLDVETVSFV